MLPSPFITAEPRSRTWSLIFIIFNMLVLSAAFMVWMERKVCAYIQDRPGPNRVGPEGLLQPFADVIKLLFKEDLRPAAADTLIFLIAPIISTATAFAAFSVVPFGTETTLFGLLDEPLRLQVTDVNVAVLVCSRSRRWGSTASCWRAGARTASTRCSARCARRRR